jgi:hypothetical protein
MWDLWRRKWHWAGLESGRFTIVFCCKLLVLVVLIVRVELPGLWFVGAFSSGMCWGFGVIHEAK